MNLTATTIKRLQALNLDQPTFNAVLEIFEEAGAKKPKKGDGADRAARGTRLAPDWVLPRSWGQEVMAMGLTEKEVRVEAEKFKNYWHSLAGTKGIKLDWKRTFANWCISMLERAGRPVVVGDAPEPSSDTNPAKFSEATWRAVAGQFRRTGEWRKEYGPPPGAMDCLMPKQLI